MCSFYSLWLIQPEHTGQNRLALSQLFLCKLKKERCSWCRCIAISLHFRLWEELSDRYAYSRCVLAYSIFFYLLHPVRKYIRILCSSLRNYQLNFTQNEIQCPRTCICQLSFHNWDTLVMVLLVLTGDTTYTNKSIHCPRSGCWLARIWR